MSLQSDIDDTVAEPGHVVVCDPSEPRPPSGTRPWLLPVLIVATTIIVGLAMLFVLRGVAAADAVGGCGGG